MEKKDLIKKVSFFAVPKPPKAGALIFIGKEKFFLPLSNNLQRKITKDFN
jgi:hypothetical protein